MCPLSVELPLDLLIRSVYPVQLCNPVFEVERPMRWSLLDVHWVVIIYLFINHICGPTRLHVCHLFIKETILALDLLLLPLAIQLSLPLENQVRGRHWSLNAQLRLDLGKSFEV